MTNLVKKFDWWLCNMDDIFSNSMLNRTFNLDHEYETNENGSLSIFIEIPGIKESNLKISVSGNKIAIEGKKETKSTNKIVSHSLTIPIGYSSDNIKAELADGVLTLTLQKNDVKPIKMVEVNK